jgi:hypothetical protein
MPEIIFWRPDMEGRPQRIKYSLPFYPRYWPKIRDAIVQIHLGDGVPPEILEEALEHGWALNPHTNTFYRLD